MNKYMIDYSFISNSDKDEEYVRNGVLVQTKQSVQIENTALKDYYMKSVKEVKYDENMQIHDFMKLSHQKILHLVFMMIDDLVQKGKITDVNTNINTDNNNEEMINVLCNEIMKEGIVEESEKQGLFYLISLIAATKDGNLGCFNAFLAGIIS